MRRSAHLALWLLVVLAIASPTTAAPRPSTNLEPRVAALEAKVAELDARLDAIEAAHAPTPTPVVTPAPTPTPAATPTPSPAQSPTPTPTPVATPTPAPTPPPGSFTVPSTIDASCGSVVSSQLNAWIAARPNGSTLVFPPGSCYRLGGDEGLNLQDRAGLTLVGTGSRLELATTGVSNFSSAFFLMRSDDIIVRGFTVDGLNTATGTTGAVAAIDESINGAAIRAGCDRVEFDGVTWDRLRGFGIFISADGGPTDPPEDIWIHDSFVGGGEMGIAVVSGRRITLERNQINDSVYIAFDLEPDRVDDTIQDVLISDNDVTGYGWGQNLTSWFVAANPADQVVSSVEMDRISIIGNRVHLGAATADNGNADGLGGLGIRANKANVKNDLVIRDNVTVDDDTQSSTRAVINLAAVHNLTITGNTQPIANGASLVLDSGTTGTRVVSGNVTTP